MGHTRTMVTRSHFGLRMIYKNSHVHCSSLLKIYISNLSYEFCDYVSPERNMTINHFKVTILGLLSVYKVFYKIYIDI